MSAQGIALPRLNAEELGGYCAGLREAAALIEELLVRHHETHHAAVLGAALRGVGDRLGDRAAIALQLLANAAAEEGDGEDSGERGEVGLADAVAEALAAEEADEQEEEAMAETLAAASGEDDEEDDETPRPTGGTPCAGPEPRVAPSEPVAVSGHPIAARRGGTAPTVWTDDRLRLLAALYPTVTPVREILARVNALPGPPCASVGSLMSVAGQRGIYREGKPVPDEEPPALSADDEGDARAMLRDGKGAKDLAGEFGGALAWWQRWCERERRAA